MKNFKGKAIYQPKGKASEYSKWASNFYVGCSNGCTYCYLKKGLGAKVLGKDKPTLKKCFKDEIDAIKVFTKELKKNVSELQKHGLFFSFTTDPMLAETIDLTVKAINVCYIHNIPVYILTKCAEFTDPLISPGKYNMFPYLLKDEVKRLLAFGFTLTGKDELEVNASSNEDRTIAMRNLHEVGFKTFASIEPVIDVTDSLRVINESLDYCDLFKVGLLSGKKYSKIEVHQLVTSLQKLDTDAKIYLKESVRKYLKPEIAKNISKLGFNFVESDFNIFE